MKTLYSLAIVFLLFTSCSKDDDSGSDDNGGTPAPVTPCNTAPAPTSNSPVTTGSSVNLNAGTIASVISYHWTGPNGFTSSLQNPVIVSAAAVNAGTYALTVMLSDSCTTPAGSVTVSINPSKTTPCTPANNTMTNSSAMPNVNFTNIFGGVDLGSGKYKLSADGTYGHADMIFGTVTQPTAGMYQIVNSTAFLQPDEVYLGINGSSSFWGYAGSTDYIYVTVNAAKITATFCNVPAYSNTWSISSTFSAKVTQP
jgi:hypothetical protein